VKLIPWALKRETRKKYGKGTVRGEKAGATQNNTGPESPRKEPKLRSSWKAAMAMRCLSSLPLLSPSCSRKACAVVKTHPVNSAAAHRRIRTHMSVATGGEQALTAQEQFQGEFLVLVEVANLLRRRDVAFAI
jgi:hypothetical protein